MDRGSPTVNGTEGPSFLPYWGAKVKPTLLVFQSSLDQTSEERNYQRGEIFVSTSFLLGRNKSLLYL